MGQRHVGDGMGRTGSRSANEVRGSFARRQRHRHVPRRQVVRGRDCRPV